jgi:hypothetical protein
LGRERIIERERRWARPAAIAAVAATALMVASFLARVQIPVEDTTSAQFQTFDENGGAIAAFSFLAAPAFLLMIGPLLYLFHAAQARNPRVRAAMVGFVFIGPVLLASQAIVNWAAVTQISSDFVEQEPHIEDVPVPPNGLAEYLSKEKGSIEKVTLYTDSDELDVELKDGSFQTGEYPPEREEALIDRLDAAGVDQEEDSDGEPGDALAQEISEDSTAGQVGGSLQFPALLGLIVAMVYVPLQAVRAGLLTRFFGTLGMALGVSVILLPPGIALLFLWIGWLGLLFVGRVPGGRPPAWEAGEAIPWLKPGEEEGGSTSERDGEAIEGEATEVTPQSEPADEPVGRPGAPKRKRKRRS